MVWARKPRTHKMWYTGARLTARDSGMSRENDEAAMTGRRNFPPRNPLKSPKTAKESRSWRRGSPLPRSYGEGRGWGSSDPWTRLWRSPEAACPTPLPSPRERAGKIHGEVEGKFSASQSIEIARNREGISKSAPRIFLPVLTERGRGWGSSGLAALPIVRREGSARVARPEPRPDWRWPIRANLLRPLAHTAAEPAKSIRMR